MSYLRKMDGRAINRGEVSSNRWVVKCVRLNLDFFEELIGMLCNERLNEPELLTT